MKVANYPFTTLEPNLGVYYELILADIPGLIEGSSSGKGLGTRNFCAISSARAFCSILFASELLDLERDYKTIRHELGMHSKQLLEKPQVSFSFQKRSFREKGIERKIGDFEKSSILMAIAVSIADEASVEKIKKILNKIKKGK